MNDKQLEAIKEQYGELYEFSMDGYKCWFRKPTEPEFFLLIQKKLYEEDELIYRETLVNTLWVDGDEILKEDDDYFIPLSLRMDIAFETKPILYIQENKKHIFKSGDDIAEFKNIDRHTFFKYEADKGISLYKALLTIFDGCKLEIDPIFYNDKDLKIALLLGLHNIIRFKDIELKKK